MVLRNLGSEDLLLAGIQVGPESLTVDIRRQVADISKRTSATISTPLTKTTLVTLPSHRSHLSHFLI